jgi:hypothetical protein
MDEPCLKEFTCPRNLVSAELNPELGPAVAILSQLEDLYVPVYFNHRMHAAMAEMKGGCAICHHYTPPNLPHPACRECHLASVSHEGLNQPGLKGAYHRQCLNCHMDWDTETQCEICHAKKAGGALHGSATTYSTTVHHEPIVLRNLIVFETEYDEGDKVPFHHRNHVEKYEGKCAYCHQQESCSQCHVHGADSHPIGNLDEIDMHDTCYQCHDEEKGCEECHGRDPQDLFDHATTGWPLKTYHSAIRCSSCHTRRGTRFANPEPACTSCHPTGWDTDRFNHGVTGVVLDEVHADADCSDCHVEGIGDAATCDACHDDDRTYSRHASFGPESQ